MSFIVDISYADGTSVSHQVATEQVTIGSAVDADVRIRNAPEVAPLQLLVVERVDGCWLASARDAAVQPLRRGKPFENGLVPWGTELDIGSVVVRVRRLAEPGAGGSRRFSFLVLVTALAGTVAVWFDGQGGDSLPTTSAAPPSLFDDAAVSCPDPGRAVRYAAEAVAEAEAREVRYPYDSQDGIAATSRYREAAACAELGGDARLADGAGQLAEALEARIEADYRALRIAIGRALEANDLQRLGATTRALRRYVDHRPGGYRDWLISLDRHVSTRLEQAPRR